MAQRKLRAIISAQTKEQVHTDSELVIPVPPKKIPESLIPFLYPLCLTLLTFVCYAQVFLCNFIEAYDDVAFVTDNSVVMQGITWHGLKWSFTSIVTGNWHPLTWWSHMIDVALFGLNPAGHHGTSLFLHVLNTILLYLFLLRSTGLRNRSFVVATFFAIHPLHVESVAWIAERKDLLSTVFGLVALHFYTSYVRTFKKTLYLGVFVFLCLSLMSKPMLVTFPLLLVVLDFWPFERFRKQSFKVLILEKIPLLVPAFAISVLTVMTQKAVGSVVDRPILLKLSSAVYSYSIYLKKFFAPYDLASFYPYSPVSPSHAILAILVLTVISVCVWRYRQQRSWLITGWLWFLGLLVPVIGIISVGAQAYADRYTYLPIVGACIVVVWLFADLKFSSRVKAFFSSAAICLFMLITWKQVGYWKDGFTLYHRELEVVKENWHAHLNLGSMLVDRKRYDEGITHYREALLNEYAPRVYIIYNLGVAYERKGDKSQALDFFRSTVQLMPGLDKGYLGQARMLSSNKDMTGALSIIREGLGKVVDKSLLQAKEAYLLHMTGDLDDAVKGYRLAIALSPYYEQNYINLGVLLLQQGKGADFSALIDQLRRVNPTAAANLAKMR